MSDESGRLGVFLDRVGRVAGAPASVVSTGSGHDAWRGRDGQGVCVGGARRGGGAGGHRKGRIMGDESMAGLLAALPVDDWAEPRRLLGAYPAAARRTAFMLVRPEAVRQGQVPDIVAWLGERGFGVTALRVVRPHHRRLEELYRYTQVRLMDAGSRPLWWYMPRYYRLGPAVALLLDRPGDVPAAERLSELKGPSNPGLSEPGLLRYEFGSQNMVMCVVHTSDLPETAVRESCLFLGSDAVESVLRGADGGTRRDLAPAEVVDRLVAGGVPTRAVRLPNFHQVLAGLQARIVRRSAGPTSDRAASLEQLAAGPLSDLDYGRRTAALHEWWSTEGHDVLAVLDPDDEAEAFLAWSARLEGTWAALTDRVIDRLRELGHDIDLWAEVSLETGLGFHDMVMTRLAPTTDDAVMSLADLKAPL
ncbi:nucleoside-diphosphate kinase [Salinispora oceanensis]|uniref:nucleoside-diphosphate kinase n=1 Tax=Salinispora oceanensis TaxID=1050199 RepID=UPI001CC561CF|nr:nucleoside-diphosphate kinase [Salinispora oceanensis]